MITLRLDAFDHINQNTTQLIFIINVSMITISDIKTKSLQDDSQLNLNFVEVNYDNEHYIKADE